MTKVRNLLAAAVVFVALGSASVTQASAINGTRVSTVMVLATQTAFIGFTNAIPGNACASSGYYIDISTNKGKAVLSIATAALLSNVIVDAGGSGTCTTPSGGFSGETLVMLNVHNQ